MEMINIQGAPEAIGPYCHAMKADRLVFCSGQIPLDPQTMKLSGNTIEEQTTRVLNNISIILSGLGLTFRHLVKTTVFLKDMDDFPGMNKVYAQILKGHKPCRSTVAVKQLPLDALVKIECVAEFDAHH